MATLKSCLAKIKKAGYDTSTLPVRELEVSSDPVYVIDSELKALRTEHEELFTTRERLMEQLRQFSPEMNEAITEHVEEEIEINRPAKPIGPKPASTDVQQGLARTGKSGLPKQTQKQAPKPLSNLEKSVEKKATVGEEEAAKVSKTMAVLRRAQQASAVAGVVSKPFEGLSAAYAVKKAMAAGVMKKIRAIFPEETSNIAAMKKFQAVAKNQVATEKTTDETPVFNKRQEKQLGAYNKKLAAQRSDEVAPRGEKETSDSSQLEGVTEQEPKTIEVRIEPHINKEGKRTELAGIVGIARRIKNLIPGATMFRESAGGGLNTYVIKVDNAEQGAYDGSPQELAAALTKAFTDGRRDGSNKLFLYDKSGEKVPVNSIAVTKLGAVVDQATKDAGMAPIEKSGKQFNAGLAYLMAEGNLSLQKPKPKKAKPKAPPSPLDNKLMKKAWDAIHPFLRKVIGAPVYMTPGDIVAAIENHGVAPLGLANFQTNQILINKEKLENSSVPMQTVVIYHEAGHIADGELNYAPRNEWLTNDMLVEYYNAGRNEQNPLYGWFHNIFKDDSNYPETSWRKEVVAQLHAAYHLVPEKLKLHSPKGYALAERMNDELQLKSEFIERQQEERSQAGFPGGSQSTGQSKGVADSQAKSKGSDGTLSSDTIIRAKTKKTPAITVQDAADYISTRQKAASDVDPRDIEETAGTVEDQADTRGFEEDYVQAGRISGRVQTSPELAGPTISPDDVLTAPRPTTTASHEEAKRVFDTTTQRKAFGKIPASFIAVTNKLFEQLGIKTKVLVVDQAGAKELLGETGLPFQWKENLEQVLADAPVGRLMLSDSSNANERFAIIYIDTTKSPAKQQRAMIHELGHIVQLAKLDQASPEIQKALRDAWEGSGSLAAFEEWFADNLIDWVNSKKAPKSVLDKFFKDLARVLRRVYNKFKGVDQTYEQFMDSLVATAAIKRGLQKPASGKYRKDWIEDMSNSVDSPFLAPQEQAFYNFGGTSAADSPAVSRKGQALLDWGKKATSGTMQAVAEILTPPHQVFTQTADAYLRANGLAWLADHFHKRADVRTERGGPTIETEVRVEFGQFEHALDKLMSLLPKPPTRGGRILHNVDRNAPEYIEAVEALLSQKPTTNKIALEARKYFENMEVWLKENGVVFDKRKNYFPITLDTHQWMANHDRVIKIAMEDLGKTRAEAENLFTSVATDPMSVSDVELVYDPRTTGTFGHAKSREFGPKEHLAFQEFINTDIASVANNYTHSAVKHVVTRRHFASAPGKRGQADPLIDLKTQLTKALLAGEITKQVYDRTLLKVIPGLFGQLGADMDPGMRKIVSGSVFYQNVRLLGLAVLPSLVDPINVMYRSGNVNIFKHYSEMKKAIRQLKDKEARDVYKMMGVIRDNITDSVINDPVNTQFYTPGIRRLNEGFFKLNGMQALTNFSRVYSFNVGRQFILDAAKKNDTKRLAELGLTKNEVLDWEARGAPFDLKNPADANVLYAIHQFVDESILRPSASMRPVWMSDQRLLVFAHLKSFIFTYHETILRRIWSQVRTGELKDPAVLVPFVGFAAIALGVAMFGYETRRQLAHGFDVPAYARADAWDYLSEATQRSGMLGAFQFLIDSVEAEDRGNMALMSLLGPQISQFEQFLEKDLSYSLGRALPGFAQSPALREWAREL